MNAFPLVGGSIVIGLEPSAIAVREDVGSFEICAEVLAGQLDTQVIVTGFTIDGTAVGKSSS